MVEILDFESRYQLGKWYRKHTLSHPEINLVEAIEGIYKRESKLEMLEFVLMILHWEYLRLEDWRNAKRSLMRSVKLRPESVLPQITLANQRLYYEDDYPQALVDIEVAIKKALRVDEFLRHSLYVKARILKEMGEYELLSDLLVDLTTRTDIPSKKVDCGREWDFAEELDDLVDKEIVESFLKVHKFVKR